MSLVLLEEVVRICDQTGRFPGKTWLEEAPLLDHTERQFPLCIISTQDDTIEDEGQIEAAIQIDIQITVVAIDEVSAINAIRAVSKSINQARKSRNISLGVDSFVDCWRSIRSLVQKQRSDDGDIWVSSVVWTFLIEQEADNGY